MLRGFNTGLPSRRFPALGALPDALRAALPPQTAGPRRALRGLLGTSVPTRGLSGKVPDGGQAEAPVALTEAQQAEG